MAQGAATTGRANFRSGGARIVSSQVSLLLEYVFQPKVFAELQNAQAVVLPYDGLNPQPPTYCYLKPHYLDVKTSYFDHVAAGVL